MKSALTILAYSLVLLSGVQAAQAKLPQTKCASFARKIMDVSFKQDTRGVFELIDVKNLKVYHDAAGENIPVEQLTYMSEGATVTIQSIPDYYKKGQCELVSVRVGRE